jgi:hypothetical protein
VSRPVFRILGVAVLASAVASCEGRPERAQSLALKALTAANAGDRTKAIGLYKQSLDTFPDDGVRLELGEVIAKGGDLRGALAALKGCSSAECSDKRRGWAESLLEAGGDPPFKDDATLAAYLELQGEAGNATDCALLLASAKVPDPDAPQRQALIAAFQHALDQRKKQFGGDLTDERYKNWQEVGAGLRNATDCDALTDVSARLAHLGSPGGLMGKTLPDGDREVVANKATVMSIGYLTAKLARLSKEPGPVGPNGAPCREVSGKGLGAGQSCTTANGSVVTGAVRRGREGIEVLHQFWSRPLEGEFTPAEGTKECARLKLRLPAKADFERLRKAFSWDEDDREDFARVVPAHYNFFWSSTRAKGSVWGMTDNGYMTAGPPDMSHGAMCVDK